jgi:hypothetical protein
LVDPIISLEVPVVERPAPAPVPTSTVNKLIEEKSGQKPLLKSSQSFSSALSAPKQTSDPVAAIAAANERGVKKSTSLTNPAGRISLLKRVKFEVYSTLFESVREDSLSEVRRNFGALEDHIGSSGKGKILNLNYQNHMGTSVFHIAAVRGEVGIFQALVEAAQTLPMEEKEDFPTALCNINVQDEDGWTPLHFAVSEGHLDLVKYLIETLHADKEIPNFDGETLVDIVEDDDLAMMLYVSK